MTTTPVLPATLPIIEALRLAALQIKTAGHFGWGNTCTDAADFIEAAQTTDAERYQWLTQQQDVTWQNHEGQWIGCGGMDLDFIIDEAIDATKEKR